MANLPERALAAAALVALLSIVCGPAAICLLQRRFREPVCSESPTLDRLHRAKNDTPTMGGIFIVAGVTLGTVVFAQWLNRYVVVSLVVMIGMALVGAVDDLIKLRRRRAGLGWRGKLLGQSAVASLPAIAIYLGWCPPAEESSFLLPGAASLAPQWCVVPWGLFVILGTTNAVNLTDGLDGLAAGCSLLVFAAIGAITAVCVTGPQRELAVVAAAVVGAAAGFLRFNRHPARVFMGNTGSLALGGALGFISLATGTELFLPLIAGVFVAEAASVILQIGSYRLRGRRVFLCAPLHHHFEFLGWPEPKVVRRFWLAGAGCAVLGTSLALAGKMFLGSLSDAKGSQMIAARETSSRR